MILKDAVSKLDSLNQFVCKHNVAKDRKRNAYLPILRSGFPGSLQVFH